MKKVVIITGAASGIGRATAEYLAQKGFAVYGVDKNGFTAETYRSMQADVNDYEAMAHIFGEVHSQCGRIDVVINNAGFGIAGAIEDASIEHIRAIAETNFIALTVSTKLAIPYLKETRGRLVNIGSVGGIIPLPYQAMYSATKAAVEVFSRAVATEVKPFGVRVVCVMPGDTKTNFTAARIKDGESNSDNSAKMVKSVGKMEKDEQNGASPIKVAKVVHKAITRKRYLKRVAVGSSSKMIVFLTKILSANTVDRIVGKLYA